jgi:hypothetical protein
MTYAEAIQDLHRRGMHVEREILEKWFSKSNTKQGWDAFARKQGWI